MREQTQIVCEGHGKVHLHIRSRVTTLTVNGRVSLQLSY
jgi:hypothetical protein